MSEYTPGPWEAGEGIPDKTERTIRIKNERWNIVIGDLAHEQDVADARLIAAAPDLLEAAKALLVWADEVLAQRQIPIEEQNQAYGRLNHAMRAAIAKAEGR